MHENKIDVMPSYRSSGIKLKYLPTGVEGKNFPMSETFHPHVIGGGLRNL